MESLHEELEKLANEIEALSAECVEAEKQLGQKSFQKVAHERGYNFSMGELSDTPSAGANPLQDFCLS